MAAEAVLGIAAQELYAAIVRAKSNAKEFEFTLANLEKTVNLVTPKILEIDRLNKKLEDFPKEEINVLLQQLEKARELVSMCSEIPRWNCYKKFKYTKRLNEMDLSLQKLLNVEFQAAQALDIQRVISEMIEMNKKLDQMNLNENEGGESEGKPRKPKFEMNYERKNEKGELHFRIWFGSRTR